MNPFVLGVDLDGVCADFFEGLRPIAAEWLGVPEKALPREISYDMPEWGIKDQEHYVKLHRFAVTQRKLFNILKPMRGAPQVLRRLSDRGVRIRIITARLIIPNFHQEAVRQTIEWLDHYDIPYWDLCFMKDKSAVGADLYLEDSPENVTQLRRTGHRAVVFTNSTNRHLPGPRADDWAEAERLVLKEIEAWKRGNR